MNKYKIIANHKNNCLSAIRDNGLSIDDAGFQTNSEYIYTGNSLADAYKSILADLGQTVKIEDEYN